MAGKLKWNGPAALKLARVEAGAEIKAAAEIGRDIAREVIGKQGPPRSRPGQPPHMDTRRLRDGIAAEYDKATITSRFGTNVPYGRNLEQGTRAIAKRPWLFVAVQKLLSRYK